jgi:hypothetical protein
MEEDEEEIARKARLVAYLAKCYGGGSTSMQRRQQQEQQDDQEQQQQQEEGKDGDDEVFRVHKSSPIKSRTASSRRSNPSSLPPGVLTENLGVPLIVVGLKTDLVHAPDSFEDEQRSQFLQQHLRAFCLKHGAALVFVSAARDTNRLLLQRYLLHRLYPELFPFSLHAQARREEALFIPAGWDSQEIVRKLLSPQSLPWPTSASFSQVLVPPKGVRVPVVGEGGGEEEDGEEEEWEEGGSKKDASPTRAWLEDLLQQQQQQQLQQLDVAGGNGEASAGSTATTSRRSGEERVKASSGGASSSSSSSSSSNRSTPPPPALAGAAVTSGGGGGSDKAQIRNFFEGLLAGGGASGGGGGSGGKK